ncbi:MAG: efflux RND transporter periplasmic adaptor subunit [Hyphomicrobiales bacterium]|nr:efflux RND transporter periplasmic adaptor subunit [Hyphomicrobiales bacterium]
MNCQCAAGKPLSARFLSCLLITLGVAGCNAKNEYVAPPPPKVSVARPAESAVTSYLELTGNTAAFRSVDLAARVPGFLETIDYKDGAAVSKGSLLFGIQRDVYLAQLAQAQGSLDAAEAAKLNAQGDYERQAALGKQDFASQARVEQAKAELDKAASAVTQARAGLDLATINLGYTQVLAPFDGVVTQHLADAGSLVGIAGPTKLATILQVDPIYVNFTVSEPQVLQIEKSLAKRGTRLTEDEISQIPVDIGLQGEDGFPHAGHLDYVAPHLDPASGTLQVRAVLDNKDRSLAPGLFARVRVPVARREKALLVRDDAIGTNQQGNYVLVVGKDDVIVQRPVVIGSREGRLRIVESGLAFDDLVVTQGVQRATPGNKVTPQQVEMAAEERAAADTRKTGTP